MAADQHLKIGGSPQTTAVGGNHTFANQSSGTRNVSSNIQTFGFGEGGAWGNETKLFRAQPSADSSPFRNELLKPATPLLPHN